MDIKLKKRRKGMDPRRVEAVMAMLPREVLLELRNAPPPKPRKRPGRPVSVNLAGQVFSSWTVVSRLPSVPGKPALWLCFCECGALGKVAGTNLVRGQSKQCRSCAKRAAVKRH